MGKIIITEEDVIRQTVCLHINWWIQANQDGMYKYCNAIDRCMDLQDAYRAGMKAALESIAVKYPRPFRVGAWHSKFRVGPNRVRRETPDDTVLEKKYDGRQ